MSPNIQHRLRGSVLPSVLRTVRGEKTGINNLPPELVMVTLPSTPREKKVMPATPLEGAEGSLGPQGSLGSQGQR